MEPIPIRIGLTLWSHNQWADSFYGKGTKPAERLEKYSSVFNTVEGNTTFYATPSSQTVDAWNKSTPEDFKFTFKLPSSITHQNQLKNCQGLLHEFLSVMEPLFDKIGQWTIQLPASFSPENLPELKTFCELMPREVKLGVEVRHLGFFSKDEREKAFNHWLMEAGINRIIMDSRPVFAAPPTTDAVIDAHQKKPKVPVHAIATAENPLIRFIGHPTLSENDAFFAPWLKKIPLWMEQGKQPYVMIHTPDNIEAPELADKLYKQLQKICTIPNLPDFPANNDLQQLDMF
ncbi:DUF72 domain-containing protein [Vibrio hannami]|uniref:DUF72 domain-containing protein n=1 Tax=Vibrio hannami TaxID=2717094 RepID=UPI00240F5BCE|nr:DUF72 domain-containing protein [Vibrio hannami]MDG3087707.1 DUF72 domain-containing protein [Vibrio hannami]